MSQQIQKAKLSKHLDPLSHIREKPGMYINHTQNPIIVTREIIDNALDEVMAGGADHIWVTLHKDDSISVLDNGRGMPIDVIDIDGKLMPNARASWTVINTGSHFDQDITSTSSGTHGVGSKATLATSDRFIGEIWLNGNYYYDEYVYDQETEKPGQPIVDLKKDFSYQGRRQSPENTPAEITHGTRVHFWPSPDVFESITVDWEWLKKHMHQQTYLHSGLKVTLVNERKDETINYEENDGLLAYAKDLASQSEGKLITQWHEIQGTIQTGDNMLKADIIFGWTNSHNVVEVGFTNSVHNHLGGKHIDGFNSGIVKLLNNYASSLNLAKETLSPRDLKPGIIAIVNILYSDPMYNMQTKDMLMTDEVQPAVAKIIATQGQAELDRYIQDIETIVKQAVARADARKSLEDLTNVKIDKKTMTNKLSNKLSPARKTGNKVHAELYIVEGDSAGGGIKRTRIQDDNAKFYQAIMPIRGKIINAAKATPATVFQNTEIATIVTALGAGYGKNFDESKLNYERLILATDADADGAQIAMLLRLFFFKYMRPMIENGHVFRALSPLYVNTIKDGKTTKQVNTYTEDEQEQLLNTTDRANLKSTERYKGLGEMNDDMIRQTMIVPGQRRLVQFTVDDFDEALDNAEMLQGKEVGPRHDFFFENAEFGDLLMDSE